MSSPTPAQPTSGTAPTTANRPFQSITPQVVRQRRRIDIKSGVYGNTVCTAQRILHNVDPMNQKERIYKELMSKRNLYRNDTHDEENTSGTPVQYRLRTTAKRKKPWWEILSADSDDSDRLFNWIQEYLVWSFQTNFYFLMLSMTIFFFFWVTLFAFLLRIAAWYQPTCAIVAGSTFADAGGHFIDLFQLSWTTFSTVGYGLTYPSVGRIQTDNPLCMGINALCAVEAFVGVLFGAMCGSVIFGKLARIQSFANVLFSDPILIQYGQGVEEISNDQIESGKQNDIETGGGAAAAATEEENNHFPCPILIFRIVNRDFDTDSTEIIDASISVVASTGVQQAKDTIELKQQKLELLGDTGKFLHLMSAPVTGATKSIYRKTVTPSANVAKKVNEKVSKQVHRISMVAPHFSHEDNSNSNDGKPPKRRSLLGGGKKNNNNKKNDKSDGPNDKNDGHDDQSNHDDEKKDKRISFSVQEDKGGRDGVRQFDIEPLEEEDSDSWHEKEDLRKMTMKLLRAKSRANFSLLAEEGEDDSPESERQVYSHLDIVTEKHPFFKRVWHVRHILNEDSPLLSIEAKRIIQENGGTWPKELCSHEQVREHVMFNQIIAYFTGTQNSTGNSVYSMKVYDYVDLNIGYTFANMLHVGEQDHKLTVDIELLNDVTEQIGGGGEPLESIIPSGDM